MTCEGRKKKSLKPNSYLFLTPFQKLTHWLNQQHTRLKRTPSENSCGKTKYFFMSFSDQSAATEKWSTLRTLTCTGTWRLYPVRYRTYRHFSVASPPPDAVVLHSNRYARKRNRDSNYADRLRCPCTDDAGDGRAPNYTNCTERRQAEKASKWYAAARLPCMNDETRDGGRRLSRQSTKKHPGI